MQDLIYFHLPTDQSTETRRNSFFFYLSVVVSLNIVPNHITDTSSLRRNGLSFIHVIYLHNKFGNIRVMRMFLPENSEEFI